MTLREYFANAKGVGMLATADAVGKPNVAIYARPHFLDASDDNAVSFIMADRASHDNIRANPNASYLFVEDGQGYAGRRLSLTRVREETDQEKIQAIRRRDLPTECKDRKIRYLVHLRVRAIRPLVGTGPAFPQLTGSGRIEHENRPRITTCRSH